MAVHKAKSGCTEAHHDTPNLPPYLRLVSPGVCTLALHVKPNAKDSAISSADGKLNVSIHAAPRDGEANSAITRYMAEVLGLRKAQVSLMVGSKSREKEVQWEAPPEGFLPCAWTQETAPAQAPAAVQISYLAEIQLYKAYHGWPTEVAPEGKMAGPADAGAATEACAEDSPEAMDGPPGSAEAMQQSLSNSMRVPDAMRPPETGSGPFKDPASASGVHGAAAVDAGPALAGCMLNLSGAPFSSGAQEGQGESAAASGSVEAGTTLSSTADDQTTAPSIPGAEAMQASSPDAPGHDVDAVWQAGQDPDAATTALHSLPDLGGSGALEPLIQQLEDLEMVRPLIDSSPYGAEAEDGSAAVGASGIEPVEPESAAASPPAPKRPAKQRQASRRRGRDKTERPWWLPKDVPLAASKYWLQRYSLFSRFDDGIRLDQEGWFSVTPEVVAQHQARVVPLGSTALDPFAGVGGNVVALAEVAAAVIAVEIDAGRVELLRHNVAVYGLEDRVRCLQGDFFQLAEELKADFVFLSPPWGGPEYSAQAVYDVERMGGLGLSLTGLLDLAFQVVGARGVVAFLPRNADLAQCARSAGGRPCVAERVVLNGYLKGTTMYYGAAALRWLELRGAEEGEGAGDDRPPG
ncbi:Trimethylguanosine synthase [Auxenochlorella protothecoides]|uniref:Trimethylguanosine synthase n=1 Tax=Auxenochlorella protothecoides TaxID=3075 RepID=A0A087SPJ0_AUXPR|nr:Trimethylguanosine synthase [Auxenochlorella protothecoides]KFM27644.1 Trimethylguanosine synthase [Auxenochlorella protothecoides]RMZ56429.1 hypothetical protein APUTEX25_004652 [Auxenochlorella protothecoides]|eukprot:RMZ56429.1 hypothetical protein APUTEX25_004652 [Auxenochlorella protothecoides]